MADPKDSSLHFFSKATPSQFNYVYDQYKEILKIKANKDRGFKKNGPQEMIKLDSWFFDVLPADIRSRKEPHLLYEELVNITKWKQIRGKQRGRLLDLVKTNTELAIKQATKKAFKKLPNLVSAMNTLTGLKGVGPASASAILSSAWPEHCPYMGDESMMATPGVEANDFTMSEFSNYCNQIKACCERMQAADPNGHWTLNKIGLALWTHYLAKELKPSLIDNMPYGDGTPRNPGAIADNVDSEVSCSETATNGNGNGNGLSLDEDSNISAPASSGDEKSNDSNLGVVSSPKGGEEGISSQGEDNSNIVADGADSGDSADGPVTHSFSNGNSITSSLPQTNGLNPLHHHLDAEESKDGIVINGISSNENSCSNAAGAFDSIGDASNLSSNQDEEVSSPSVTNGTNGLNSEGEDSSHPHHLSPATESHVVLDHPIPALDEGPALKKIRAE